MYQHIYSTFTFKSKILQIFGNYNPPKQELELKVKNAIFSITRIVKVIFNKMRFLAPILSLFHYKLTFAASLNNKIKSLVDRPPMFLAAVTSDVRRRPWLNTILMLWLVAAAAEFKIDVFSSLSLFDITFNDVLLFTIVLN